MDNNNNKQDTILEKIDEQIKKIEEKINSLLEDVDMEMITPVDRIELAIKFQSQLARFIALRKSSELSAPEGREAALLAVWMKQLRGENIDGP